MREEFFHGYTPVASGNQVFLERPRVNRLLEKAAEKSIISVIAGAGYGKTSAVYDFVKKLNVRTGWLQLSQRDNQIGIFWENFVSAVSIISEAAANRFRQMGLPDEHQQFKKYFSDSGTDAIPNQKYIFVYDDLHLVTDKQVLSFLEICFSGSFPNVNSVIISRREPEINIAKLESRNMLARITEDELRFSQDEMVSYFRLRNASPSPQMASAIYRDTEGWAFAIHLAGISLENAGSYTSYVPMVLRSNTSKFIESEIIAPLSPGLRRFLIKLSLIENLDHDLVKEIGKDNSLIGEMERIGSFIRFESYLGCYRIHPFLMDYLREKQGELSGEEKKDVWTKTALWCAAHNRATDALICCEKSGDYLGIGEILNNLPLILPPRIAALVLEILDRAPKSVYREYPGIILIHCRTLISLGRFEESKDELLEALPGIKTMPESPEKHGILMLCYVNLGFIHQILSLYTRRYDFVDYFREAAAVNKFSAFVAKPPLNGATLSSYACRIMAPASKEDMDKLIETVAGFVPYSAEVMGGCQAGLHELCLGEYAFFRINLEEAERRLLESIVKARANQQYEIQNRSLFYLLRIYLSRGDTREIENVFRQLKAEREEPLYPNRHFYYDIIAGWYYIQTDQKEKIALWLKSDYEKSELCSGAQGLEKLVKVKYYISEKQYPAALAALESRLDMEPLLMGDIEMKVLEAACRYRSMDRKGAYKALEEAYNLASPASLFMPFAELGKDMRALVETARKEMAGEKTAGEKTAGGDENPALPPQWLDEIHRNAADYAKKLYRHTEQGRTGSGYRKGFLSHRETEVLIGLSRGLTRMEIAGAASISPNTVKSVTRSLYNKLGALNQADAVRIASEKGFLEKRVSQ